MKCSYTTSKHQHPNNTQHFKSIMITVTRAKFNPTHETPTKISNYHLLNSPTSLRRLTHKGIIPIITLIHSHFSIFTKYTTLTISFGELTKYTTFPIKQKQLFFGSNFPMKICEIKEFFKRIRKKKWIYWRIYWNHKNWKTVY